MTASVSPVNGATGVAIAGTLTITYNEGVLGGINVTLNSVSIPLSGTVGGTTRSGSYSGLNNNQLYTVTLGASTMTDRYGNALAITIP